MKAPHSSRDFLITQKKRNQSLLFVMLKNATVSCPTVIMQVDRQEKKNVKQSDVECEVKNHSGVGRRM